MSNQRKQIEDQALNALLVETLGKVEPPDLTEKILARLAADDDASLVRPVVTPVSQRPKPVPQPVVSRRWLSWKVAAALAASLLLAVWLYRDPNEPSTIANKEPNTAQLPTDPVNPAGDPIGESDREPAVPSPPRRGIPMMLEAAVAESSDETESVDVPDTVTTPEPVPAIALVSRQVDSELTEYWNAIGIEPTTEADAAEVVSRLALTLGVKLPDEAASDPERLEAEFARAEVAQKAAARWLRQITDQGLQRVDEQQRQALIDELASCFQGKQPLDRTLAHLIDGRSPLASSFYGAISHGGQEAMARRLASLTMNVDLRCVRCHDATIEGDGRQADYWSFAALLQRGVSRGSEGQLAIDPEQSQAKPLFYELPDGRQRLAEPMVASGWLGASESGPIDSVKGWASQLEGSRAMARGAVNSLWQLVHGQPLQGRVVDPITAPDNDALNRIEEELVQDLIRSRFNVGRTLSLIVASPATRRSVPSALLGENALVVSDAEKQRAIDAVNAFAAALPRRAELSLNQRVDLAMRAIGGKLGPDGGSFVAQVLENDQDRPGVSSAADSTQSDVSDFPIRGESLPVQWLTLIEDQQSQIDHLGYLAGIRQLPNEVRGAVKAMQDDGEVSKELLLNRVWWLVSP